MSLCKQIDTACGQVFDLAVLFFALKRFCIWKLKRRNCPKPEECGTDVVTSYIWEKKLRREGRCEINGDEILINIPGAINQKKVLYKLLSYEVLNKSSRCRECRLGRTYRIADEAEDQENEPRSGCEVVVDPVTPEGSYMSKEQLEKFMKSIKDPARREAFKYHLVAGYSYEEIGRWLHIKTATVRKWFNRDIKNFRKLLTRQR